MVQVQRYSGPQTMVSGPEARQSPARTTSDTIYEKHAEPGISDTLPNFGRLDSKFRRAVFLQDRSGDAYRFWLGEIEVDHGSGCSLSHRAYGCVSTALRGGLLSNTTDSLLLLSGICSCAKISNMLVRMTAILSCGCERSAAGN